MGEFCMTVAGIGWLQKKAAAVIFGAPPESDFNEALGYSLKAAELEMKQKFEGEEDPHGVGQMQARSALNCAKCYVQLSNQEEAKVWYERALLVKIQTETDRQFQEEAKEALQKM